MGKEWPNVFFQNLPWTIKERQLVVWLDFPTRSFDWDLELAFLVFPNFGYFTQYLTESKEPIGGPSQYYTENHNKLLKNKQAWAGQKNY